MGTEVDRAYEAVFECFHQTRESQMKKYPHVYREIKLKVLRISINKISVVPIVKPQTSQSSFDSVLADEVNQIMTDVVNIRKMINELFDETI